MIHKTVIKISQAPPQLSTPPMSPPMANPMGMPGLSGGMPPLSPPMGGGTNPLTNPLGGTPPTANEMSGDPTKQEKPHIYQPLSSMGAVLYDADIENLIGDNADKDSDDLALEIWLD